jgi:hypothetical protein
VGLERMLLLPSGFKVITEPYKILASTPLKDWTADLLTSLSTAVPGITHDSIQGNVRKLCKIYLLNSSNGITTVI